MEETCLNSETKELTRIEKWEIVLQEVELKGNTQRSVAEKLQTPESTICQWLKHPDYRAFRKQRLDDMSILAFQTLEFLGMRGLLEHLDVKRPQLDVIKLALEISGRYNPKGITTNIMQLSDPQQLSEVKKRITEYNSTKHVPATEEVRETPHNNPHNNLNTTTHDNKYSHFNSHDETLNIPHELPHNGLDNTTTNATSIYISDTDEKHIKKD